jgi:hypothetical protein
MRRNGQLKSDGRAESKNVGGRWSLGADCFLLQQIFLQQIAAASDLLSALAFCSP